MSDEGLRIEFGDKGPYLFDLLDVEPQATLLEEHDVCLLQFDELYMPVSLDACKGMADGLSNMSQAEIGPERAGMTPMEFELDETTELPLLSGSTGNSFQYGEMVYMDVLFGDTEARLCFSVRTATALGHVLSQVPA